MPGAYAHLTGTLELAVKPRLKAIPGFPDEAVTAVLRYSKYCEMGALGPDYPYLTLTEIGSSRWARLMHHRRTGELLKTGVEWLKSESGSRKEKCLAWLLGFASHIAFDVTIHPVIALKVGPYEDNKIAHWTCEMHEDVFIFRRLNLGPLYLADMLRFHPAGGSIGLSTRMDEDIVALWRTMLRAVYPDAYAEKEPDFDKWFRWHCGMIDKIAEEVTLLPIARHVGMGLGLVYPKESELDDQYLLNLEVPGGGRADYETIFERAKRNTANVWQLVAAGACSGDDLYLSELGDWNLDTGLDTSGSMVLWG